MNAPAHLQQLLPTINQRIAPPELIGALKERFGERCSTALVVREHHGRDESHLPAMAPDAVAWPSNTEKRPFTNGPCSGSS